MKRLDLAPQRPPRGSVEYRVVWQRESMQQPKSKLFQTFESAKRFADFLRRTVGQVRSFPNGEGGYDPAEPMEDIVMLRIDYRDTGRWRRPEWDGWEGMEPETKGLMHLHPYHVRRNCSACTKRGLK